MKIHHQLFNTQSTKLSLSSEIDNIIQEGKVIFKNNPSLIDSSISKRQGDQTKYTV